MMNRKIILLSVIFLVFLSFCITSAVSAQDGTIRGSIYEKETGEPIIFTNVYLYKTTYGAATDVNGIFVISRVPKGSYTLMVTYLGYDTLRVPVTIKGGEIVNRKLYLKASTISLKGISITSTARTESKTETRTSVTKITPRQVKQLPSIGGQPDLAQYLQVVPGVIFTGDQGGQLYIRGGSPIQNKVLLDGMIIYNPFHSIGLFSVFETDIIRNADIYTGGFGAEYGGRISSVMDIRTRDGNKKRIAGKFGASTFGGNLLLEGPLKKQTDTDEGSSSFIFSLKNSYLEQSSKIFYKNIDSTGLPFNYTDVYGKISFNSQNGSKVNFFGFNFSDKVDNYKDLSDFNWNSSGGGVNFVVVPGKTPALMEGVFAYSKYKISMLESEGTTTLNNRNSEISGFNGGLGFTYFLGKDELKYGVEMLGFKTIYDYINTENREIEQLQNTTELAGYVKYKWTKGKFLIEPGFRLQWYASLANISPEPRLAIKYNANSNLRFKLAAGLYSQNLISANSDRDVVNLFYGFLSGSDNLPETFDGKSIKQKLQKSDHLILGVEYDGIKNLTINVEGYYKYFPQLTNINRDKIYEDTPENSDKPDYLKKDYIIERGDAEGIDFSFKYEYSRLYLWAVYSYAFVHRSYETDHMINYVPVYDRRHNINLVASYQMGENKSWETSLRWNFGSGFPFTLTQGYYESLDFSEGVTTDYTKTNGNLGIQYSELNSGRLPYYHRLDFSIKKTFTISKNSKLEADFSITNVYDRKNIFYINRITADKIYQLPFMPSFGLNFMF